MHTRFHFSGTVARRYDAFNHLASLGLDFYWRWVASRRVGKSLKSSPGPHRVLDLAGGTLDMALAVRKRMRGIPGIEIIATDLSHEMLALGRRKLEKKGAMEIATLNAAGSLPFPDSSISASACAFGVRNFTRLDEELGEMARVLRPGGRFYTLEFFRPETRTLRFMMAFFKKLLFPLHALVLRGDRDSYGYLARSIEGFLSAPEYRERLEKQGLEPVETRKFFFGLVHLVVGEKERRT